MTVLIVDDEKVICDGLRTLIERLGLPELTTLRTAYRADDALQIAREITPHILITDIRMPGKTGLELIADARRVRPDLRAIIVTGYDDFELVREALRLEAIDYLLKPATRDEVRAALKRAVDEIRRIEESRNALDNERQSYFDSLIDAAWPWFAEGVDITPGAVRRLDEGLHERIGFEAVMSVAFESRADDAAALGRALLDRVSSATGGEAIWRLREKGTATIGVVAAATTKRLTDSVHALARAARAQRDLHFSYAEPRSGIHSLPSLMESLRRARVRKLSDDDPVHVYRGTDRPLDSDRWVQDTANDLAERFRRSPRAELTLIAEIAKAIGEAAENPDRVVGLWRALEHYLRRAVGRSSLSLPPIEGFFTVEQAARSVAETIQRAAHGATGHEHRAVGQAKAFVAEHYHEQHTMQDVADRMGMSYAYFSTLFKQQTGETYSGYLTRIRMEEAARLLDAGLPVSKVAGRVGYLYPKHFTRAFKRFQGQTPQQYTAGQAAPHAPDDCRPTP
ncbi:MAG: response regulator transcription factor [Spirochaetota bacterium]